MNLEQMRDKLAKTLADASVKIVFAESCTGGLCAATMAQVEGISEYLCGSAVTYRPNVKREWLDVSAATIEQHSCESLEVAEAMAVNVLSKTPEADFSAAVVGNIGQAVSDRSLYVSVAGRDRTPAVKVSRTVALQGETREQRQREAAEIVLRMLRQAIESDTSQVQR